MSPAKSFAGASSLPPSGVPYGQEELPLPEDETDDRRIDALIAFYPRLLEMIRAAHPKVKVLRKNSRPYRMGENVLVHDLVTRDNYKPGEIIDALTWCFCDEHRDATFWRKNVCAVQPLRKRCKNGLRKFDYIHEAWTRATGAISPVVEGADLWTGERIAEFERDLAEEQTTGATV